jgi:acyl-CoA synthetase (AMP-forming)/AMP-acid ligase II
VVGALSAVPPDVLTVHAEAIPDKLAVIEDRPDGTHLEWSFAELEEQANRLANVLIGLGAGRDSKVVWCGPNSPALVRLVHAARKAGATAVPLNYRLTPEEAAYVVANSDACVVYADAEYAPLFEEIRSEIPKVEQVLIFGGAPGPGQRAVEELLADAPTAPPARDQSSLETVTMIYTSGTTGKPKGAWRRRSADPEQTRKMLEVFGYTPDDVYLTTGPIYHSGPGGFMSLAHGLGNTVIVQRKFDPEDWLRLVDEYQVTSTFSAPTPIRMVTQLSAEVKSRYRRSSMRCMVANAAPWSFALKQAYLADFPEESLFEVYGSTELGVNTILRPEDQRRKRGSCGRASPGIELVLFDEQGQRITQPNVPGELYARSASPFASYYKAEEKTAADRRGDFQTVGDVAYFDEEGFFYICDRKRDMIISGGMNIYPAEIEAALEHHEAVADVAVFGIPSETWGESVHAVVVAQPGAKLSQEELIDYARTHLAGYKIPRSVEFVDEIPRTGSGKILKRELRAPYWKDAQPGVA